MAGMIVIVAGLLMSRQDSLVTNTRRISMCDACECQTKVDSHFRIELELSFDGLEATAFDIEQFLYKELKGKHIVLKNGDSGFVSVDDMNVEVSSET